jgi:hypothetical protein
LRAEKDRKIDSLEQELSRQKAAQTDLQETVAELKRHLIAHAGGVLPPVAQQNVAAGSNCTSPEKMDVGFQFIYRLRILQIPQVI